MQSCQIDGRGPLGQLKAWLTTHGQWEGSRAGRQPYLMYKASWKACLCRVNPYSAMGMAVSQEDAPLSLDPW